MQVTLRTLVMVREILEIQWLTEWDLQNKKKLAHRYRELARCWWRAKGKGTNFLLQNK